MSKGGGGGANYYPMPTIQASNSATSSSTNIPQWLTDASQFGVQNAQNIINQGTPQYNGPLSAGLSNSQTAAGNLIQNSIGQSQPYFNAANNAINNSMNTLNPQTLANGLSGISQYMNPYIDNVVNSVNDFSKQNLDKALTQTADQALAARAFGGSRHGIQEGVATAQNNLNTNNLLANLLSSGYNQATNMLGTDVQAQNQAAQQNNANALAGGQALSNLGMTNQTANNNNINNLLTYGNLEQQTNQNALTNAYNYWQYQNQYPLQAQQVYNQTVSSAPHSTSSTGSSSTNSIGWAPQQQATSNPLMGGLGGAMAGGQVGSYFGPAGAGIGAVGGGLLGLTSGYIK
jgi:hypothetical protein